MSSSNQKLNLRTSLQGTTSFLEIQSVNTDHFEFSGSSQLGLKQNLTVQNMTVNGTLTTQSGQSLSAGALTATTSLTTPKIIGTDNNENGLVLESSDGSDFIVLDTRDGVEKIDIKKDVNTAGNKITMGTNGSRGIIQYGNIKNSTIDNTNTVSANTTGTASAWTSNMTLNLANPYTGQLMNSASFNGSSTTQLDANYIDESSSVAHKFVLQNSNSAHTDANLQTRIDFLNQHQSGMTNSNNRVAILSAQSGLFSTIIYDTAHASNASELRLHVDYPDDIPSFNNFVFWDTTRDGERFMKLVNLSTTYDSTTAQKQYPTSIHFGNGGDFKDTVVGNTIAKIQANWRDDGQGQLKLLARRTASSTANECGFLISNNAGSNAIQQNQQTNNMIVSGQKIDGFSDIKYFNGCAIGSSSHLGHGLQYKDSGSSVISGTATGYDNTLELKLKSGGGLTADSDGLYFSGTTGEWTAGSGTEIIASPHKVIGLFTDNLTGGRLTGFSGSGESTLKSSFNHIFGRMDNDTTAQVDAGLTIVGYNEGGGGDVGGHSQLVLHNAHRETTDGLLEEIGVFRLENEGDLVIQMGKNQENNTDQIYNSGNGLVYDKMKFYREGGTLLQLGAFNGTDNVLANWNTYRARNATTKNDHTFTLYNHGDDMLFEMICGNNNLISGSDVGSSSVVSTPSGFRIVHKDGGDTHFNNNKVKALIFEVGGFEKMRVHDNGNVGFGGVGDALTPNAKVEIVSNATDDLFRITGDDDAGADYFSIDAGTTYTQFNTGSGNRAMVITHSTRRIGMGTTTAPACPLHVGTGVAHSGGGARYFGYATGSLAFDSSTTDPVSVRAEHAFLTGSYFLSISDNRIKQDIEDIDDGEALQLINRIEPKKYNYIDPNRRDNENKTIGFIAQQVEQLIPNAVITQNDFTPNMMIQLDNPVWEDNKLIYDMSFNDNETGKVRFYVEENEKEEEKDLEYNDGGFKFKKQYNRVFIYGKEVNDFKTVSKDKIFAVNVSATQELSRKNDLLENKCALLETENNNLLERTQVLEDTVSNLESLINDLTKRVKVNETTLHGLIN